MSRFRRAAATATVAYSMTQVCDFSDQAIDLNAVKNAGLAGCISYASDTASKNWAAATWDECVTLGLTRTCVCEQGNQPALRGASGGTHDAQIANAQMNALGYSIASTIYYVAEDPNQLDQSLFGTVAEYFTAVKAENGRPVGGYGGWALLKYLHDEGLITKGWMVETWNQGAPNPLPDWIVLMQMVNNVNTHGLPIDVDDVLQPDYGQDPRPTPPPSEETAMITGTFTHNGQRHVCQASLGVGWHKYWTVGPNGEVLNFGNETLAGPTGGTAGGCSNNKATIVSIMATTNADGSVDITMEDSANGAWCVSQKNGGAAWTGGKLS